jgi:hypothetical protein
MVLYDKEIAPIKTYAEEWYKKVQFLNKFVSSVIIVQKVYIESVAMYEKISLID